jgi:hypothetical protein
MAWFTHYEATSRVGVPAQYSALNLSTIWRLEQNARFQDKLAALFRHRYISSDTLSTCRDRALAMQMSVFTGSGDCAV